jgi:hypothetical protein
MRGGQQGDADVSSSREAPTGLRTGGRVAVAGGTPARRAPPSTVGNSSLLALPDELLTRVVEHLPTTGDAVALAMTARRGRDVVAPLVERLAQQRQQALMEFAAEGVFVGMMSEPQQIEFFAALKKLPTHLWLQPMQALIDTAERHQVHPGEVAGILSFYKTSFTHQSET